LNLLEREGNRRKQKETEGNRKKREETGKRKEEPHTKVTSHKNMTIRRGKLGMNKERIPMIQCVLSFPQLLFHLSLSLTLFLFLFLFVSVSSKLLSFF